MNIFGKAAVVTGASRGVGKATAMALAKRGCSVLLNYSRSRDEAEQTAELLRASGGKAVCFPGDVSDDGVCREMMDAAAREFGRLDILVNNAGTTRFIPHGNLDEVREEDWNRILGVNVIGPFQCVRAARKYLEASVASSGPQKTAIGIAWVSGLERRACWISSASKISASSQY